jgi:copper(I)-binding protein
MIKTKRTMRALVGFFVLSITMAATLPSWASSAKYDGTGIRVVEAWARASIGTARPAAAYVTLVNDSTKPALLLSVSSPAAGNVNVHKTVKDGEVMKMVPADSLEIPAGERIEMKPGGYHIMLMELRQAIRKGETLDLALEFAGGAVIDISARVMGPGARGPNE